MPARFYCPGEWGELVELPQTEAEHFARVLRGQTGDQISLFNGLGGMAEGVVTRTTKRHVEVRIVSVSSLPPVAKPVITLAVAPPKGDRLRWMIEKATELGVDEFIPVLTDRGVVSPSETKLGKLEQTTLAACKQSGRTRLMKIDEARPLKHLLDEQSEAGSLLLFGSPQGRGIVTFGTGAIHEIERVVIVIGPEGGLTEGEEELLETTGARGISLSPHILRVETAAIAAAAWFVGLRPQG